MENNSIKENLKLIKQGFYGLGKILINKLNIYVYKYPYAFIILILVICLCTHIISITSSRLKENSISKVEYIYQNKIDSLQMIIDNYKSMEEQRIVNEQHRKDSINNIIKIQKKQNYIRKKQKINERKDSI